MHIFPTTFLEIAVYIYIYDDFPLWFLRVCGGAGGGYDYTCTICGGKGGVNYKLLSFSKSNNFHGGRDESGLLYSLISSIGL